jgi:hypothetical protein
MKYENLRLHSTGIWPFKKAMITHQAQAFCIALTLKWEANSKAALTRKIKASLNAP